MISFTAYGVPQPKGSTRSFIHNGRAVTTNANAKTKPWQQQVAAAASVAYAMRPPTEHGVTVAIQFIMPRPKTVKRATHTVKPDIDKLTRTVLDALTGIAYVDDSQVIGLRVEKLYGGEPCAIVSVSGVDET